jgi:hypothetical protein
MTATVPAVTTLQEVVHELAAIERGPGSRGEREAAEWLVQRLDRAGARSARIEEEQFHDGYAGTIGKLTGAAGAAGLVAAGAGAGGSNRWRALRVAAGAVAGAAGALIADDISNGPRIARRVMHKPRATCNVVAEAGDPLASRTLVVLAHHDAAPTGRIFDDRLQRLVGEMMPGILERIDTSLPLWWLVLAGPGAVLSGAAARSRRLAAAGAAISAVATAAFADIARSPIVPGANDNLTAVAVLVALAERLAAEPLIGLRTLLVSCGAEEVIQGGIYGFARRHFPALDRERTWVLNLETLGSPRLVMLEGEGPVVMEDYFDRSFRDLIERAAAAADAPLRRGMRARNSTDAVIPSRAGYPTATLASMDRYKALSNYHMLSDTPENVDFATVEQALTVTESVARALAADRWLPR